RVGRPRGPGDCAGLIDAVGDGSKGARVDREWKRPWPDDRVSRFVQVPVADGMAREDLGRVTGVIGGGGSIVNGNVARAERIGVKGRLVHPAIISPVRNGG